MDRSVYSHERVAWCYDWLADRYSLGGIARAKGAQVEHLKMGQRVLYVGVGSGEDAVAAARAGAEVACLDVAPAMLAKLRVRLARENRSARLIAESVFDHVPERGYEVVIANFFLNMYRAEGVARLLEQLHSLLGREGVLMIADFAPPRGPLLRRMLQGCYYAPVNLVAWGLGLCALHPIYDYADFLPEHGFELIRRQGIPIAGNGPAFFETLIARRVA